MDINKMKKPIHIQCPHCKKDLAYSVGSLKSRREGLIKKIRSLEYKLSKETIPANKRVLKRKLEETLFKLRLLKEDIAMLSWLSEFEKLKIFKKKVGKILDKETYIRLSEESEKEYEEENTYNYYDVAMQKYTDYGKYMQ